ncbi:McrB family protein [Rhodococcus erythropolis]|uniref:McrB family protein n=1 Tax=Rhodococcus erythropolis TaxID=1833 RepID=UPI0037B8429D
MRDRPQLIFYGPPGAGKSYIAKDVGSASRRPGLPSPSRVFHPAYSYEDFFEGFRPTPRSDGQVGFELKPGPMRRLTDRARTHPDQLFVLVVDEINRGNLAKFFGELYFLLEYRDEAIDLMYSSDNAVPFHSATQCGDHLPRSSTADRSIALVDTAMRRRFGFVPLHPAQEPSNSSLETLAHRP